MFCVMGRTKRHRVRKCKQLIVKLNNNELVIELNRWMKKNYWNNETKLELVYFPDIGRGIISRKMFKRGDIIIEIPFTLMISYATLEKCKSFKKMLKPNIEKLTIEEMLCLYLVLQIHLKEKSFWYYYIKSLPVMDDLILLWLCSDKEMNYLDKDLSILVEAEKKKLEENWSRVKLVLNREYTCGYCKARADDIVTRDIYTWAHILVNTRSVFVPPDVVRNKSITDHLSCILLDEPSVALSPFLDMFNHSSNTHTTPYLSEFNGNYFLVTTSNFKKYDQIFISYGPYDNKRLLFQYGFILRDNFNDEFEFNLQEILKILDIKANSRQYKFLREREFDKKLSIKYFGLNFNMAAVLYVLTNVNELDWNAKIFAFKYTQENLRAMYFLAKKLLHFKLNQYELKLEQLVKQKDCFSKHFKLYFSYLENAILFVNEVIRKIEITYHL